VRAILIAAILAAAASLAACQIEEAAAWGTVVSVQDAEGGEHLEDLARYDDDHPLVPEVGWEIVVQLDDGAAVTVMHNGTRRYEPGERVRLFVDDDGALLL
jgi:hypothetical protein